MHVLSSEPVHTSEPEPTRIDATEYTSAACPAKIAAVSPSRLHSLAVQSCEALRNPTPGMIAKPRTVSPWPRSVCDGFASFASRAFTSVATSFQTLIVLSAEPLRNPFVSGSATNAKTELPCASASVFTHVPRFVPDHTFMLLSIAPETIVPSLSTHTAVTSSEWPSNRATGSPYVGSPQTTTEVSLPPDTTPPEGRLGIAFAGTNASAVTNEACPTHTAAVA